MLRPMKINRAFPSSKAQSQAIRRHSTNTEQGKGQIRNEAELSGLAQLLNMAFSPHALQTSTTNYPRPIRCSIRESKKYFTPNLDRSVLRAYLYISHLPTGRKIEMALKKEWMKQQIPRGPFSLPEMKVSGLFGESRALDGVRSK